MTSANDIPEKLIDDLGVYYHLQGREAGIREVADKLSKQAAYEFTQRRDDKAKELRTMSESLFTLAVSEEAKIRTLGSRLWVRSPPKVKE